MGPEALLGGGQSMGMGMYNMYAQQQANSQNIGFGRQTQAWQEHMSNTAHQREVQDLIKAGINPTLTAGTNGAGTPPGSTPNVNPVTAPDISMPNMMAVTSLNQNQQKIDIERQNAEVERVKKIAEIPGIKSKKVKTEAETRLLQKGAPRADLEGEAATQGQKLMKWLKQGVEKHWGNSQPPGSPSRPTNRPFIDDGWLSNSSNPDN